MKYYEDLLNKHYPHLSNEEKENYLTYCLKNLKENIITCHSNENKVSEVIKQIFKRATVKKYNMI